MKGKIITETSRLFIREFTQADAAFILKLVNTEGWLKYIGDRHIHGENDALGYLEKGPFKSYATHGFGLWKCELISTGSAIGMCGLLKRATLDLPDLGFAFLPEYTGAGYGYESAVACLDFAGSIGIQKICAITVPGNSSSIRLLEKVGMHFKREITMPPDEEVLHLYLKK